MPESLKRLVNLISYMPWVGEKSAMKLAFFLLNSNKNYIENLKNTLSDIKDNIATCSDCHALIDSWEVLCSVCKSEKRENNIIVVVEEYLDYLTIEQTGIFNWKYHILWWAISPINGVFVWDLNIDSLFKRVEKINWKVELIMWTNPNIEGEATSSYIKEEIENRGLSHKVFMTKLSRGLSSGYIEYADNITLISAIKDRKEI